MDWLHIVLRVIHIGAATFWVGSAAFLHFFIEPTVRDLGPQGGSFVAHMTARRRLPVIIAISGVLTIGAGIWLYWRDTNGFDLDIITTSVGIGFTVGAVAAIFAFVLGFAVVRPLVVRMGGLGQAMASGQPSPAQIEEMGSIQRRLRSISTLNVVLLLIAVVAMASARYL